MTQKWKKFLNVHIFAEFVSFCFLAGVQLPMPMQLYPFPGVKGEGWEEGGTDHQQQHGTPHAAYRSFWCNYIE